MAQFYPVHVTDIRRDTRDSVILTLEPPAENADDFKFIQGQYLTFRHKFDGEELRRQERRHPSRRHQEGRRRMVFVLGE
jgi:ring-1,2-phenylacetyl-CoA epoxidase subunit PaaE